MENESDVTKSTQNTRNFIGRFGPKPGAVIQYSLDDLESLHDAFNSTSIRKPRERVDLMRERALELLDCIQHHVSHDRDFPGEWQGELLDCLNYIRKQHDLAELSKKPTSTRR